MFSLMDVALRKESEKLGKINSMSASTGKEMENFFFPQEKREKSCILSFFNSICFNRNNCNKDKEKLKTPNN